MAAGGEAPGNTAAASTPHVPPAPEVSEGHGARGPLRVVGMAAPLTVGGRVLRGVSTLVPPASVRLAPPPAWWIEHERQRLAALYPGLCPDGTHPMAWYGPVAWYRGRRHKPGWQGWLAAARPWAGAAALAMLVLAAVELAAQHYFRTAGSMLGLGFVAVVLMHRLAVQAGFQRLLVEARQSRLFQAHIMAGDDIPGVVERFYALAVDRARPLLVCGLLLAAAQMLLHGLRGMAGLAVVLVILMLVYLATAGAGAPPDSTSDSARAHLYLACLLSQWTRHLPFALVGGTVVMAVPAVLVLLITPGLLVRRLGWALGWGPGLTTMVLLLVVVGQFLLLVDLLERLRQRYLTLPALLEDLGENP